MAERAYPIEEVFMVVAFGVHTMVREQLGHPPERVITGHWIMFQSPQGEQITVVRERKEELPEVELGAVHVMRIVAEVPADG